ncbi:MAG: FAD-dependent oxidoreductase [Oscillospiraceae bacterium]|nr:FAD-dependent oxidoreductase [Oscillospiraceae bacterium]
MKEGNTEKNFLFISTGEFDDYGGWALDTQFIQNMGSSYLLAHGIGTPVANAVKKIDIKNPGRYKVWAYTKDWVARWKKDVSPGLFKVKIDGWTSETLGNKSVSWAWQEAGVCEIDAGEAELSLIDLTGFEGRCAAVFLTMDMDFVPPDGITEFEKFRNTLCNINISENAGKFDIIIAGGGISGMAAAVSSAKNGLNVALIQDRYVLGGNNSSEVRVWLGGETGFEPFPKIGDIVKSFEPEKHFHYGKDNIAEIYEDDKRISILEEYKNIKLFLGYTVVSADVKNGVIHKIKFIDVKTHRPYEAYADYFADCTGDATLGFLADADYEITTNGHMGMTNVWYVEDTGKETEFPKCPWAIDLSDPSCDFPGRNAKDYEGAKQLGGWYWESGMEHDPIKFAEEARDTNFRAMYGAFDALKNTDKGFYKTYKIGNACYIGGKRESRRLLGDVILSKSEVLKNYKFEDGCVPSTWQIDVHYAKKEYYPSFHEGDAFLTNAYYDNFKHIPYFVPYRCLYSRNIKNLFMAGRNVSVTHDALGTVRVMRTGGMMGEVVGYAAALCKKYGVNPCDIYENHLGEFLEVLRSGQISEEK